MQKCINICGEFLSLIEAPKERRRGFSIQHGSLFTATVYHDYRLPCLDDQNKTVTPRVIQAGVSNAVGDMLQMCQHVV